MRLHHDGVSAREIGRTLGVARSTIQGRLQESHADLEKKVELRTHELAQSVAELRALGEVSQAVNSTLDLQQGRAVSETDRFGLRSTYGMDDKLIAAFKERHIRIGDAGIGQAASQRAPLQIADL